MRIHFSVKQTYPFIFFYYVSYILHKPSYLFLLLPTPFIIWKAFFDRTQWRKQKMPSKENRYKMKILPSCQNHLSGLNSLVFATKGKKERTDRPLAFMVENICISDNDSANKLKISGIERNRKRCPRSVPRTNQNQMPNVYYFERNEQVGERGKNVESMVRVSAERPTNWK